MAELKAPIARSPIAGRVIRGGRTDGGRLTLLDQSLLAKVAAKADPVGPFAQTIGVPSGRATRRDGALIVGSGPGEWIYLGEADRAVEFTTQLTELAGEQFVSIVDLTHGRALLRLTGPDAFHVLAKICAIDCSDQMLPNGTALRTSVAKLATDLIRDDTDGPSVLLHCERSCGQYLFDCVLDAAREFGVR